MANLDNRLERFGLYLSYPLKEMNTTDPNFPYGLVFEHIAVFVDAEIVFHKPSPAIEVPYKLDFFESAVGTLKYAKGFEITWHLKRSS